MAIATLEDLFAHELKDLYSAEKQLVRALPKMARAATNEELRAGFEEHLEQTKEQVQRLEEIFSSLEISSRAVKCVAMEGLIEEGSKLLEDDVAEEVLDAALIGAAQKVEHYEIAGYGTLVTFARQLGHSDAERLLQQSLDEEKQTDQKLTELAESGINAAAQSE
jgi:ferritin-like metal-binding protein YciE